MSDDDPSDEPWVMLTGDAIGLPPVEFPTGSPQSLPL